MRRRPTERTDLLSVENAKIAALVESWHGPLEPPLELDARRDRHRIRASFVGAHRPVVVRRFLEGTALDGLTFEDVRQRAGHLYLDPTHKPALIYHSAPQGDRGPMRLSDYLDQAVFGDGPPRQDLYARFRNLRVPRTLRSALGLIRPDFLRPHEVNLPCIWMGGAGATSNLHTDPQDNFVLSVIGRRRFWVHPPSELALLRATSVMGTAFYRSAMDPRDPDHPAACQVIDLGPGDLFLLPLGWPHFVECLQPSFTYNYWLDPQETPFFLRQHEASR